jgi:hypothetical protein
VLPAHRVAEEALQALPVGDEVEGKDLQMGTPQSNLTHATHAQGIPSLPRPSSPGDTI